MLAESQYGALASTAGMQRDAIVGCILGIAVGDAIGLPYEGMNPRRASRVFKELGRHHFVFGRGMVSDDTEHTCLVAEAILEARGNHKVFAQRLACSLRWWLLGIPAGVGLATLRACLRLWMGVPPDNSGVFSAGNGPAMRSALLGVVYGDNPTVLRTMVGISTRITHVDPKALSGALTVAIAAHQSSSGVSITPYDFGELIRVRLDDSDTGEFLQLVDGACLSAARGEPLDKFAESIGCGKGISGYMLHTVPCVIQTWLRHQTAYRAGVEEMLAAGGDTDTTAAILGGITGAGVGKNGIPSEWLSGIVEWPRRTTWMEALGDAVVRSLAGDAAVRVPPLFVPGVPVRNAFFMAVVLAHGLRRLVPPY
ncbi:MAG: ADP-ribosylglycohydrolase family protein [bacterium]